MVPSEVDERVIFARPDGEDDARSVARSDDDVVRPSRTVHEVPLPQRPFLTLEDCERFAGEHQEVLLIGLPVVHRHRLTRAEDGKADSDLREVALTREARLEPVPPVPPAHLTHVQDEPSRAGREKSAVGRLERSLGNHHRIIRGARRHSASQPWLAFSK